MTARVDKLAARGLVRRRRDPADRRGVRVRLTDAGRIAVDAALDGLLAHENGLLAALSPTDRTRLAELLRTLVQPFDAAAT
jgi:DNA-binding MarR family transcriptional regulator